MRMRNNNGREQSRLRNTDERCADIVSSFLDENFYSKKCTDVKRIFTKDKQVKGIDIEFKLGSVSHRTDEKSAIRYVNKGLMTYSMELSMIDRSGCLIDGWLVDEKKVNDSYLFIWIDKADNDILRSKDDIRDLEIALVSRKSILHFLEEKGYDREGLLIRADEIRADEDEWLGNIRRNGYKFSISRQLVEKPVNVIISRQELKKMAEYTERFVR